MKKLILTLTIFAAAVTFSKAQVIPSFQLGIKGGINFSKLSSSGSTFGTVNMRVRCLRRRAVPPEKLLHVSFKALILNSKYAQKNSNPPQKNFEG